MRPEVCSLDEIGQGYAVCDPSFVTHTILAEGDSWFTVGGTALKYPWFTNLLFSLRFKKSTLIVNLARPGDTIKNMSQMSKYDFRDAINNLPLHAILLSAGGNDLIDKASLLVLPKSVWKNKSINSPKDYCNLGEIKYFLDNLTHHFIRLAKARGNKNIPIVTHTYDYPTPRNAPAKFFGVGLLGPWLIEVFKRAEVPKKDWRNVSDYLFNRLADHTVSLQNKINNFHVVDTRGTIKRAKITSGVSGDWLNEIHPNKAGYKKLAPKIVKKLYEFLP